MKVLFIGGTGNISAACVRRAMELGHEVFVLNRGLTSRIPLPSGAQSIQGDIQDADQIAKILSGFSFDIVANFIAFNAADAIRDVELFADRIQQYFFISSASAYEKPPGRLIITESTPLKNPFWQYSRDKIAAEEALLKAWRERDFPVTIVRPSLTYEYVIPVVFGAWTEYTIVDRMRRGEPIIVHGDGTSVWTITHSTDFARGFVGLFGRRQALGQAFHITSDELLTWNQIYAALGDAAGVEPQIVHIPSDFIARVEPSKFGTLLGDKSYSAIFDNAKIKAYVPDFVATIPFEQGIRTTLEWFEAAPSRMVINPGSNEMMDRIIGTYERRQV